MYTKGITQESTFPSELRCPRCDATYGTEALYGVDAGTEVRVRYRCPGCGFSVTLTASPVLGRRAALAARRTPVSQSDVTTVQEILRRHRGDLKSLLHSPPQHRKKS